MEDKNFFTSELFYGNLGYLQNKELEKLIVAYKPIIKKFTSKGYVFPNDEISRKETIYLKEILTPEILAEKGHRHIAQDDELFEYLKEANRQMGFNDEVFDKIEPILYKVINPLVLELKKFWNRARPFQYAYYFDIDLHPLRTLSGHSPSYPSGHTMQAETWALIMKSNYPELSERIDIIKDDVSQARMNMGVHFPSDIQFGKQIIEFLWSHNLINKQ